MQIPGGVIMPDSSRIKALEKRVSALEAVVEKFTFTNRAMDAIAWLERCFKYVPDCTWRDDLRRFIESQRHQ